MEEIKTIKEKTIELIDALKATCQTYGMGNDGNEYKIITQVFLYKFLNDKFGYEVKKVSPVLKNAEKWELVYAEMSEDDRLDIFDSLPSDIPLLNPEHLIANLWNQQAKGDFDLIFDSTMTDIADKNIDIFSTQTAQNTKIPLFEKLTQYVTDDTARAPFARALVDKLVNFSFEEAFEKHYDFFADIFEYLIKDYNTAGGGKYAEYYTPHAIATIMAKITHQDVGQMDMYIRMYDELKRSEGDNPTIGIVLCSDTDDDIARYSVMHGNEQLFASKYKLYLPTKEELKAEIETQKAMFYLQQQDNEDRNKNYTFNIE